ncbi:putative EMP1-like protein, partial [Plasmodium gaboni]
VRCGIKDKEKTSGEKFSGNECGRHPPNDTDDPFVWWFKEWGQQFCIERKKHMKDIKDTCNSNVNDRCSVNGGKQELKDQCKSKCDAYQKFISDRKKQWTHQKSKYEREHSGMKAQELLGLSYPECVGANFEKIFGNSGITTTSSTTQSVSSGSSVKPSSSGTTSEYSDASDICSCTDQTYNCDGSGSSTCRPKSGDLTSWRTGLLKTGKNNKKLQGVYAPPRRQKLCLANLHPINFGNDNTTNTDSKKNDILNRLQIVAEREAYYLWLQHTSDNPNDTSYHNRACCAIRASFFDIGDIVKGTDLWDDESKKYIDETLKNIFEEDEKQKTKSRKNNQINTDKIRYARKKWWEGNRKSIWDAMKCGVKNAMRELDKNGKTVSDDKLPDCMNDKDGGRRNFDSIPTPQFVRWLEEWTQQFCDEYKTYFGDVETQCKVTGANNNDNCNTGGKNDCKKACTKYNDWIKSKKKEWDGMSKYYEDVKGKDEHLSIDRADYHAVSQPTAIKYLNQKCNQEIDGTDKCCHCEKLGKENTASTSPQTNNDPLEHMEKVVNRNDDKYKKYLRRCNNCYIQHINDQINEIKNILDKRREKEEDDAKKKYDFDCEINGNQGNGGDTLCEKLKDDGKDEEAQKLKVPVNPDGTHSKKNKENDGNMNCGGIPSNKLDNNIQIPPRRQKLCYNGLDDSKTQHGLKYKLFRGAANDAYNLGIKHPEYKNHYGVKPCKALQYSFNDYKHIIMGTDNLENDDSETNKAIKESLQNYNASKGKKTDDKENRKQFWEQNKKCVWDVMVCGYNKGKDEAKKNKSNGNKVPELNSPEGGGINNICDMPDTNNNDQFLSWMQEWYDDYCNIRKKLKSDVENNCSSIGQNFNCETCPTSCNKYQEYMKKKKQEWEDQQKYYTSQKSGPSTEYTENNATEYLKKKFPNSCSDQSSGNPPPSGSGDEVEKNITALTTSSSSPYYDADSHCGCKKYIEDKEYEEIKLGNNCQGLKKAAGENKIKWDNSDGGLSYLKEHPFNKDLISPNVYLPPRKQKLCFQDLDSTSGKINNKEKLRNQLMKVAATEGYNLGQYYKAKKENETNEQKAKNYAYDVLPCNALKYSFLDLRSIIIGYDMVEHEGTGTEDNLKRIFKNDGGKNSDDGKPGSEKRKEFWKKNKECVWNAMLCGYQKGNDNDLEKCDTNTPSETEYPIGDTRDSGKNYQFLRWFAEWGEDFCKKQTKQLENLKKECEGYECNDEYTEEKKNKCDAACTVYKEFIQKWNEEYLKQRNKYDEIKKNVDINGIDDVKNSHAYQYLHTQLEKHCSKNDDCKCMKKIFTQLQPSSSSITHSSSGNEDMSASLDGTSSEYGIKCNCPETENMNCVEETAKNIKAEAKKNLNSELKGDNKNIISDCDKVDDVIKNENGTKKINEDQLKTTFPSNGVSCPNEGTDRFDVGKTWRCNNINKKHDNLCLPPRREHMCIKKINDMMSVTVNNKDELLKEVIKAAQDEAIDILKKLKPEKETEFSEICDAMKYSFADIGDIIRGRDLWNKDKNYARREQRLKSVFTKIYQNLESYKKKKYTSEIPNFYTLRSDWWNTNRKNIWKAMTCVAPNDAKFQKKKDENGTTTTSSHVKCGHLKTTPVDDYIPQPFRWLTEWSEYYCKGMNKKLAE